MSMSTPTSCFQIWWSGDGDAIKKKDNEGDGDGGTGKTVMTTIVQ